jgi:hypothetical protein
VKSEISKIPFPSLFFFSYLFSPIFLLLFLVIFLIISPLLQFTTAPPLAYPFASHLPGPSHPSPHTASCLPSPASPPPPALVTSHRPWLPSRHHRDPPGFPRVAIELPGGHGGGSGGARRRAMEATGAEDFFYFLTLLKVKF